MAENSLTNFATVLYSEAEKQKNDVEKQLKDEREKILAEKSAELETKLKREIENCHNGLKHEIGLAISNREAELAKLLRHKRYLMKRHKSLKNLPKPPNMRTI